MSLKLPEDFWKGINQGLCPVKALANVPRRPTWFADRQTAEVYAKPTLCRYQLRDEKKADLEPFTPARLMSFCPTCEFKDWVEFAYGVDPMTNIPISTEQQLALAQKLGIVLDKGRLAEIKSSPPELGFGRVSSSDLDRKIFERLCKETKKDGWIISTTPSVYYGGSFHPETVICDMDKMRFLGATELPDKPFTITLIWSSFSGESTQMHQQRVVIKL